MMPRPRSRQCVAMAYAAACAAGLGQASTAKKLLIVVALSRITFGHLHSALTVYIDMT